LVLGVGTKHPCERTIHTDQLSTTPKFVLLIIGMMLNGRAVGAAVNPSLDNDDIARVNQLGSTVYRFERQICGSRVDVGLL
jgi:hypothetical protein